MNLRRLDPGERSGGVHLISAVDDSGQVVERFECTCAWCEVWRAAEPMMAAAVEAIDRAALGDRQ